MQHRDGGLRLLGDVQEAEGVGAVGVDDGVQIDLAHALEGADEEGVGAQKLARRAALDMPLAEARVELLEEGRLLGGELDRLLGVAPLQSQPAVVTVPRPWSLRIFCTVIAETRLPSSASIASIRLQP